MLRANGADATAQGGLAIPPATSKADGEPISLKAVSLPAAIARHLPKGLQVFSLFYWSRGVRCQAYLDVPAGKEALPLLLELHGGELWNGYPPGYTAYAVDPSIAAGIATNRAISFLPNYAGYGPSRGSPGDPHQNYLDVANGLAALGRISGLHVLPRATYLVGLSMGGDVAMILAAHDRNVRAAELVSPYPGPVAMMEWMNAQGVGSLTALDSLDLAAMVDHYGGDLNAAAYRNDSYVYSSIHVPVLIIGGTNDPGFPPPLLRTMYHGLKRYDSHVTIRFFNGSHAPDSTAVNQAEAAWFNAHGLKFAWPWS